MKDAGPSADKAIVNLGYNKAFDALTLAAMWDHTPTSPNLKKW